MLREEAGLALMLLTRVPAAWLAGPAPVSPARAVWAFPLVGAAIGAAGALVLALCQRAGMPPLLAACWTWAATMVLTGALHEDGLADLADGFGGGRDAARKLEIMRDSRIGSYGALALVLSTAVRVAAIASLDGRAGPALIAAGALSRGSMAVPLLLLAPARPEGQGAAMRDGGARRWIACGLSVRVAVLSVKHGGAAAVAALMAGLAMTALARCQIGGFTGDVLGGCAVVSECAALTLLACVS